MIGAALSYFDGLLAIVLSDPLRVAVWSTFCGLLSMYLYAIVSPQQRLAELRSEALDLQKKLVAYNGEFAGATSLMRRNLSVSFRRLGYALAPSLIAGVPVIVVLLWMADSQSTVSPEPGDWVTIEVSPPSAELSCDVPGAIRKRSAHGAWCLRWPADGQVVQLHDETGVRLAQLPLDATPSNIGQRSWFSTIMASHAAYLPAETRVRQIQFDAPQRDFVGFAPPWMRSWLTLFLVVTTASALAAKCILRIA